jgi:ABC-2 type transport system ATP-binding protein
VATRDEPVISVRDLGIEFYLARRRKRSLREILFRGASGAPKDTFWALQDVNFDVYPGEAIGVVGGNGGGKSTLLKAIAGVLLPDRGNVEVKGGVAPLIELTGGFRGELSARDNITLMAGLHGLTQEQVMDRFDGILDFAGDRVKEHLDTPYRHFSSGMQVRLGFSVMTALDEPIILVDEVLAVGDKAFREKCYGRMGSLLAQGRTLFLVSHSENDLRRFASRGLYLKEGKLVLDATMPEVLDQYNADNGSA